MDDTFSVPFFPHILNVGPCRRRAAIAKSVPVGGQPYGIGGAVPFLRSEDIIAESCPMLGREGERAIEEKLSPIMDSGYFFETNGHTVRVLAYGSWLAT